MVTILLFNIVQMEFSHVYLYLVSPQIADFPKKEKHEIQ